MVVAVDHVGGDGGGGDGDGDCGDGGGGDGVVGVGGFDGGVSGGGGTRIKASLRQFLPVPGRCSGSRPFALDTHHVLHMIT